MFSGSKCAFDCNEIFLFLCMSRTSGEASLESQSELEPAQPSDDASLPSTSQEPTSSSAPGACVRACVCTCVCIRTLVLLYF